MHAAVSSVSMLWAAGWAEMDGAALEPVAMYRQPATEALANAVSYPVCPVGLYTVPSAGTLAKTFAPTEKKVRSPLIHWKKPKLFPQSLSRRFSPQTGCFLWYNGFDEPKFLCLAL